MHQVACRFYRFQLRAGAFGKADRLTERIRDDENIGKQDGCIRMKPSHRLHRHFSG